MVVFNLIKQCTNSRVVCEKTSVNVLLMTMNINYFNLK